MLESFFGDTKRKYCVTPQFTVPEPICASKIAIGHQSPISYWSVIDLSNRSIIPVIASSDHRTLTVFSGFCCYLCQFYKYLHNIIDVNINLNIYFTFLLFRTDLTSFYKTKLRSDRSLVINPSAINQSTVIDPSNRCADRFKDCISQ